MRIAVLTLLAALTFTVSAQAAPVGFHESTRLEAAASFVAGKPVKVWCASTRAAFAAKTGSIDAGGYAIIGGTDLYLPPIGCGAPLAWLNRRNVDDYAFAVSMLELAHEATHLRGSADEGATDCAALAKLPTVIRRFFPVKGHDIDVATLLAYAQDAHDREAPAYHTGTCG